MLVSNWFVHQHIKTKPKDTIEGIYNAKQNQSLFSGLMTDNERSNIVCKSKNGK